MAGKIMVLLFTALIVRLSCGASAGEPPLELQNRRGGNLVAAGDSVSVQVRLSAAKKADWSICDWLGNGINRGTAALADGKGTITIEGLPRGYYEVTVAGNGQEALERAFVDEPDVIIMDLSLPIIDGWEATRRLKADERTRHIPVVALTGHALAGHSRDAREAGCDGFISKPCMPQTLADTVKEMLALAEKRKRLG